MDSACGPWTDEGGRVRSPQASLFSPVRGSSAWFSQVKATRDSARRARASLSPGPARLPRSHFSPQSWAWGLAQGRGARGRFV